jgi:hypothetical protein
MSDHPALLLSKNEFSAKTRATNFRRKFVPAQVGAENV